MVQFGRPIAIRPGYQIPLPAEFFPEYAPIKRGRCSIARPNRTTPKYPNVDHGVAVGWPWGFCFITPIAFVGGMGGWCCGAPYSSCKWIASVLYSCRWCWDVRCVIFLRWREHNFWCDRKTRTKSQTSIIAQKNGGPQKRPTKLEAVAINICKYLRKYPPQCSSSPRAVLPYRRFGDTIPVPTVARVQVLSPKLW